MSLTPKEKASILRTISAIDEGAFDEREIKLLLIDIREYTHKDSLIRELGHFIAHKTRDSGKFHQQLDFSAAVIKNKIDDPTTGKKFSSLNFEELTRKQYDLVFDTGWSKLDETTCRQTLGHAKSTIEGYFKSQYTFSNKYARLKDVRQLANIQAIAAQCLRVIYFGITSAAELATTLNRELAEFFAGHMPGYEYQNSLRKHPDDVALCVMSLLQGLRFELYDGTPGWLELREDTPPQKDSAPGAAFLPKVLELHLCFDLKQQPRVTVVGPAIVSNLQANRYMPGVEYLVDADNRHYLPPLVTKRGEDGQLILTVY